MLELIYTDQWLGVSRLQNSAFAVDITRPAWLSFGLGHCERMSKKTWFICFGCLLFGLALGCLLTMIHFGAETADSLALANVTQVVELGGRAFKAYRHEDRTVAIYALTDYLTTLQNAESIGAHDSIFLPETELQRCLMFTHARLAKLLADDGRAEASAAHVTKALKYAQETDKDTRKIARFTSITNASQLFDIVSKFDEKGVP
jgi:hypothetical protein